MKPNPSRFCRLAGVVPFIFALLVAFPASRVQAQDKPRPTAPAPAPAPEHAPAPPPASAPAPNPAPAIPPAPAPAPAPAPEGKSESFQKKTYRLNIWQFVVAILTLVVLAIYTGAALYQASKMRDATDAATKQTTLMRQQLLGTEAAIMSLHTGLDQRKFIIVIDNRGRIVGNATAHIEVKRIRLPSKEQIGQPIVFDIANQPVQPSPSEHGYSEEHSLPGFDIAEFHELEQLRQAIVVEVTNASYTDGFGNTYPLNGCTLFIATGWNIDDGMVPNSALSVSNHAKILTLGCVIASDKRPTRNPSGKSDTDKTNSPVTVMTLNAAAPHLSLQGYFHDSDEFRRTASIADDTCGTTVDVRPFGDRQSDAVYSCLYQMCVAIKEGTFSTNAKSIFVLHDTGTDITSETFDLLKNLWSLDVGVNLKEADS